MEKSYPWTKALNVSEIDLERWLEELPAQSQLLNWCLDHEKINPNEYYEWAKNYYGLAFIDDSFFKTSPNIELWEQIQSVSNWSPYMVPVRQWDGVVFIACVEPQNQIPWSFPVRFLLASRRELLNYWMNLHNTEQKPVSHLDQQSNVSTLDIEPKLEVKETKPSAQVDVQSSNIETSESTHQQPVDSSQNVNDIEAPEGFPVFDTSSETEDQSPEGFDFGDHQNIASTSDAPEGFDFQYNESNTSKDKDLFGDLQASAPSGTADVNSLETSEKPESFETGSTEAINLASQNSTESNEGDTNFETSSADSTQVLNSPNEEQDEQDFPQDLNEATAVLKDANTNLNRTQSELIGELKTRYQNVVLLIYENHQMIPVDWDSGLNIDRQAIDMEQPSFLKVVYKSKKPYHGYLSENQFHQNLFKSWGLDNIPKHVTAMPIIEDSELKAVVVGIGDEGSAGYQMLHFVETAIKKYPFLETQKKSKVA